METQDTSKDFVKARSSTSCASVYLSLPNIAENKDACPSECAALIPALIEVEDDECPSEQVDDPNLIQVEDPTEKTPDEEVPSEQVDDPNLIQVEVPDEEVPDEQIDDPNLIQVEVPEDLPPSEEIVVVPEKPPYDRQAELDKIKSELSVDTLKQIDYTFRQVMDYKGAQYREKLEHEAEMEKRRQQMKEMRLSMFPPLEDEKPAEEGGEKTEDGKEVTSVEPRTSEEKDGRPASMGSENWEYLRIEIFIQEIGQPHVDERKSSVITIDEHGDKPRMKKNHSLKVLRGSRADGVDAEEDEDEDEENDGDDTTVDENKVEICLSNCDNFNTEDAGTMSGSQLSPIVILQEINDPEEGNTVQPRLSIVEEQFHISAVEEEQPDPADDKKNESNVTEKKPAPIVDPNLIQVEVPDEVIPSKQIVDPNLIQVDDPTKNETVHQIQKSVSDEVKRDSEEAAIVKKSSRMSKLSMASTGSQFHVEVLEEVEVVEEQPNELNEIVVLSHEVIELEQAMEIMEVPLRKSMSEDDEFEIEVKKVKRDSETDDPDQKKE